MVSFLGKLFGGSSTSNVDADLQLGGTRTVIYNPNQCRKWNFFGRGSPEIKREIAELRDLNGKIMDHLVKSDQRFQKLEKVAEKQARYFNEAVAGIGATTAMIAVAMRDINTHERTFIRSLYFKTAPTTLPAGMGAYIAVKLLLEISNGD